MSEAIVDDGVCKVLLIEDNVADASLMKKMLLGGRGSSFEIECATRLWAGLERLTEVVPDVILLDLGLPDSRGLETFTRLHAEVPQVPIIVLSGLDDESVAIQAVREGAQDYLVKGEVDGNLLPRAVRYAIERKQAEETLKHRRDYYQAIINGLHDQVMVVDHDYRITGVNAVFLRQRALDREDVIGKSCYEMAHRRDEPCDGPEHRCPLREVWQMGQPSRVTHAHMDEDGAVHWFDVTASPLRDPDGQVTKVIEVYRDVTVERRLEERLTGVHALGRELVLSRDERQIAQVAVDAAMLLSRSPMCALWLVDEEERTLTRWAHTHGAHVVKLDTLSLADAEFIVPAAASSGETIHVPDVREDPRYRALDGDLGVRSVLCVPLKVKGRILGVMNAESDHPDPFDEADQRLFATLADYTALALENAQLYQETTRRLTETRVLQEVTRASASTLDFDELLSRVLQVIHRMLGVDGLAFVLPDEVGEGLVVHSSFIVPERSAFDEAALIPLEGSLTGFVYTMGRPILISDISEESRYFEGMSGVRSEMAVPVKVDGKVVGVLNAEDRRAAAFDEDDLRMFEAIAAQVGIVMKNVHLYEAEREQRKLLEQSQAQLVQSEKLAATGRLTASLAHEINNPLQAIHNSLQIMLSFSLDAEEQREYVQMADEEVERLIDMVGRMLDFARKPEQEKKPTDVNTIVEKTLMLSNKYLQHSNITLHKDLAGDLPPILGVPGELRQVFLNLVLNAVDAMPEGGRLSVASSLAERGYLMVAFSDTGGGVPPEDRDRIFEPFFSTKEKGTGLGLSVSYNVVKQHGGEITVEGEVGEGTTVVVRLPTIGGEDGLIDVSGA